MKGESFQRMSVELVEIKVQKYHVLTPWTSLRFMFHLHLPCSALVVFKDYTLYLYTLESTLLLLVLLALFALCYVWILKESGCSWGTEERSGSRSGGSYRLPTVTESWFGYK